MGNPCSTLSMANTIGISGNHNFALMLNGVNYNISSIFSETINQMVGRYRSDLITVHFASVFFVLILTLMMVQCLIPHHPVEKQNQCKRNELKLKLKIDVIKYRNRFKELDKALDDIAGIFKHSNRSINSVAHLLQYVDNIYTCVHSSPYMKSVLIKKLIDKNYVGLCVAIVNLKDDNIFPLNNTWHGISSALHSLNLYTDVSQELCQAAVDAGIIPLLTSSLSQISHLENLEINEPVMFLFQTATRIFLHIAQIDELKNTLEKYNCCEILFRVVKSTDNGVLRAIVFSTIAQISKDRIIKFPFNIDDGSTMFRLYYESSQSKDKTAYGIKQSDLLNAFCAIGRLESQYYNTANN